MQIFTVAWNGDTTNLLITSSPRTRFSRNFCKSKYSPILCSKRSLEILVVLAMSINLVLRTSKIILWIFWSFSLQYPFSTFNTGFVVFSTHMIFMEFSTPSTKLLRLVLIHSKHSSSHILLLFLFATNSVSFIIFLNTKTWVKKY